MSAYTSSFNLLDVQESAGIESSDEEVQEDTSQLTSPLSKKARARRRAAERKAAQSNGGGAAGILKGKASMTFAEVLKEDLPAASGLGQTQNNDGTNAQLNGSLVSEPKKEEESESLKNGNAEISEQQKENVKHEGSIVEGLAAAKDFLLPAVSRDGDNFENVTGNTSATSIVDDDSTEDDQDEESSSDEDDNLQNSTNDAEIENDQNENSADNGMITPPLSPLRIDTQKTHYRDSARTSPLSPSGHRRSRSRAEDAVQTPQSKDHAAGNKTTAIITRTVWTFAMLAGFIFWIMLGHAPVILLIFGIETQVFRELTDLFDAGSRTTAPGMTYSAARIQRKVRRARYSKVLSWFFFAVTNYYLYGETIVFYFRHIVLVDAYFIPFAKHHRLISLSLYLLGFVGFVSTLKKETARRQFGLFCWIHVSLFLVVVSAHFIVNSVLEGLIWLVVPASLVICNDIWAYICGMAFGKTPLIQLSPKKTVEGFVGGFVVTLVFGYFWATLFMRFPYFVCPCKELGTTAWNAQPCELNPAFLWHDFELPSYITAFLPFNITSFPWAPFQLHTVALGVFASLFAPFGGFFASGFKRAYNIKDFGDSIPGHGGLTDRMDCQFMMGMWTYFYYVSMVRVDSISVASLLQSAVSNLSRADQQVLLAELGKYVARTT